MTVEEALRAEVRDLKAALQRCWKKRREYNVELQRLRARIVKLEGGGR